MYKGLIVVVTLSLAATLSPAAPPDERVAIGGSKDYKWNERNAEMAEALRLRGDVQAGQEDYKAYCEACHLPNGRGNPHGRIPQLAGQHPMVVIKQLADIRSGLRSNPTMYPFVMKLRDAQALANVAAYLATLCCHVSQGSTKAPTRRS